MSDIVERAISPFNPATNTVQNRDKYNLFAPMAGTNRIGMAGFNPAHFRVDEQIVSLNDEFSELSNRMDTAENDIDNLEGRVTITEGDISNLEGRVTTAEGDIDNLEGRVTTAEGDIDNLEGRVTITEGDISNLEGRVTITEGDIDTLENRASALETGKVDKTSTGSRVYGTNASGHVDLIPWGQYAAGGSIVARDGLNNIHVTLVPGTADSATSKQYVDDTVEAEEERAIAAELALSQRIEAQEGLGGSLDAHDFGKTTPTQQELTDYALLQIPSIGGDALKIWNGTRVTNLHDNNVWQLTNTQNTNPTVFEWANIGSAMIAQATNEILGIVKGSDSVRVNSQGEVYTSVSILGAIPSSKEPEINEAVEKVNNAVANMEATLGLEPLWDAEGENELLDAEEEYLLSVAHIDANSINGREFYVMSKAEHAALIQAGTYIPDAFYLTF